MSDICYPGTTNWNGYVFPTDGDADLIAAQKELAEAFAWSALKTLTGGRLGICPVTVRPSRRDRRWGSYYVAPVSGPGGAFRPHIAVDGEWVNSWCGDDFDCGCEYVAEIKLPGPVGRVIEVVIDGEAVDHSAYRIDDGYKLVRQDGQGWPYGQNMDLPIGAVGTFYVKYIQGAIIDSMWDYAAGQLAIEFFKNIALGGKGCKLPRNVQAVTRQGVTFDMDITMFDNGKSGIPEVDAIVATINPFKLKVAPQVMSPDTMRRNRQTTSPSGQPGYVPAPGYEGLIPDPNNPGYFIPGGA